MITRDLKGVLIGDPLTVKLIGDPDFYGMIMCWLVTNNDMHVLVFFWAMGTTFLPPQKKESFSPPPNMRCPCVVTVEHRQPQRTA